MAVVEIVLSRERDVLWLSLTGRRILINPMPRLDVVLRWVGLGTAGFG